MGVYIVKLLLDDSVPAQATLLGQIQTALNSVFSNVNPTQPNVTVQKIS